MQRRTKQRSAARATLGDALAAFEAMGAAALFVTVHTVEAALTRIYGELGVRSRSELAGRFKE